ncbi:MAG: polysaccharide biosynthesis/export family protein, partial [Pirellulales bacterium]
MTGQKFQSRTILILAFGLLLCSGVITLQRPSDAEGRLNPASQKQQTALQSTRVEQTLVAPEFKNDLGVNAPVDRFVIPSFPQTLEVENVLKNRTPMEQLLVSQSQFRVGSVEPERNSLIQLCAGPGQGEFYQDIGFPVSQNYAVGPHQSPVLTGVDSMDPSCYGELDWNARRPIPWQIFAQGEYVGPHRSQHVLEYRLRVDDEIDFVYRLTRAESHSPYQLKVGDQVRVESLTDATLNRELVVQPDGSITVLLLGQVQAARKTVSEVTKELEERYLEYYKVPAITVTPLLVNTKLEDLRASVDSRAGFGGQGRRGRVTPEGTIQLPAIGSVPAQGLTLDELKREIDERYNVEVEGIEVSPILVQRAPRYVYVIGEVPNPGHFELVVPEKLLRLFKYRVGTM